MTPEQTKSAYQRACEQECELCAKGVTRTENGGYYHRYGENGGYAGACTAPSKEAFMERQAAQIAAMQSALAKALPKLGHGLKCLTINPTEVWVEKGSWNDDACQCLISEIRKALSA